LGNSYLLSRQGGQPNSNLAHFLAFFFAAFFTFFPTFISSCGFGFIRTRAPINSLVFFKSELFVMTKPPKQNKPKQPDPPWTVLWPGDRGATKGDTERDTLLAAVGFALSTWEMMEEELADIFTTLIGAKWGATRAYGSVNNFYGRADMLETAAETFFYEATIGRIKIAGPDREVAQTQPDFIELMKHCRQFTARRNDIAHGRYFHHPELGYFLRPPRYNSKKFDFEQHMFGSYSYTSVEINTYRDHFSRLIQWARDVRSAVEIIAKKIS
jgi:hypothetical protein